MKSKLFSITNLREEKDFAKDLKVLVSLPDSAMRSFADGAGRIWLAPTERETRAVREDIAKELKIPIGNLKSAFSISQFFIGHFVREGEAVEDKPEDLVEDLKEFEIISSEEGKKLLTFLVRLKDLVVGKLDFETLKRNISKASIPSLAALDTTVNYRPVFSKRFQADTKVDIYHPKCLGIVPIAIVALEFDEGPVKEAHFQVDRRKLRILIDHLRATEKKFEIADEYLRLKSVEKGGPKND